MGSVIGNVEDVMSTERTLANIDRVELREVWAKEASEFTPWLAANISKLGAALGLDLVFRKREAEVGGYSLDILAYDPNRDRPVVVENQLEPTDHNHLGKLLTYAAGFDASVVVWLTSGFRDEHRQALDWLNQRTGEDTQFFGVVVELWKIDESRPAPHFNIVAAPNDWRKERVGRATGSPSAKEERYFAFFQDLIDRLREDHEFTTARRAQRHSWFSFSCGFSRTFQYAAAFDKQRRTRVEVYIDSDDASYNRDLYLRLEERKDRIETDLGYSLDWQPLEENRACRIATYREGTIDDSHDVLEDIRDWMVERLLEFRRVFKGHFQEVTAS